MKPSVRSGTAPNVPRQIRRLPPAHPPSAGTIPASPATGPSASSAYPDRTARRLQKRVPTEIARRSVSRLWGSEDRPARTISLFVLNRDGTVRAL